MGEPPVLVREDPEARHLAGEPVGIDLGIRYGDTEEDAEPAADRSAGRHLRPRDPLDDGSQATRYSSSRIRDEYVGEPGFIELASL